MSQQDRATRIKPKEHTFVNLNSFKTGVPQKGLIENISQSGAFLWHCYIPDELASVVFPIKGKKPIIIDCRIVRKDEEKKYVAIQFDKQISLFELSRITGLNGSLYLPGADSTFDLAKIDRAEVFREANQIKTCASNYFMWAIGLILPITLGIWALAIEGKINTTSTSSAMIAIVIVFSVAVFSNLEKARAINMRESFIAALDYYLNRCQGPLDYRGWFNLKHCFSECGTRRRAKVCPMQIGPKAGGACRDLGEDKASIIRSSKRVFPSILDSFISLTSFFYAIVFFGLVILTSISFINTWYISFQIPEITTLLWFSGGFFAGSIIWRNKFLLTGVFLGVILCLIAGVVFTTHNLLNCVSGGIGAMLGAIAWFCLRQIIALRVGHYSFETLVHTWFEIFENCIFLPDDAPKGELPKSKGDKFFNRYFSYISASNRVRDGV